jgi:broad specificity phosphatase PhoE
MARLILIRHGETDWNIERRSQGWNDQPLNDHGHRQAALVCQYVQKRFAVETVWSSDLRRCTQTARALGLPVRETRQLRELRFGDWEGRLWPELHTEEPALAGRFVAGDPAFQAPGGEPLGNLVRRARRFIGEAEVLNSAGTDTVIVGHGGSLKGLTVALLNLPDTALGKFHFSNASVTVVDTAPGLIRLHSLNDTSHLAEAQPFV